MNSGKIVADGTGGLEIEGSTRGPRGPKNRNDLGVLLGIELRMNSVII